MGLQSRLFFPIGSELQGLTRNQDKEKSLDRGVKLGLVLLDLYLEA